MGTSTVGCLLRKAAAVLERSQELEGHGDPRGWDDSTDDGPRRWRVWCSAVLAPYFLAILCDGDV